MLPIWVVAADRTVCRIFASEAPGAPLQEIEVLTHPEGRLREQDLVSDLPGRTFDSQGAGRHAKEVPVSPKQHEALVFAKRIADRLEAGRVAGAFGSLALVAAPRFLGLLREKLPAQVRARVVQELDRNLSRESAADIAARLPESLAESSGRRAKAPRRSRKPEGAQRAPMASFVPRPVKRRSGRTPSALVPAHVRSADRVLKAEDRAYIRGKLGTKLGKFAGAIERVSVRFTDVNGPRGGVDTACSVKVVLSGLPSVVVQERDRRVQPAIDRALGRVERAVRSTLTRRRDAGRTKRTKPT